MKIRLTSVLVDDQESALNFYTKTLGFEKKQDFLVGQFRWLTVVSPEEPDGTELLLEPSDNAAARSFKESMFDQGIAAASFEVDDIQSEFERLQGSGVQFRMEPTKVGTTTVALFEDTCGNILKVYRA
jgi:predicted enzyme related to lactoylglutathione lyase